MIAVELTAEQWDVVQDALRYAARHSVDADWCRDVSELAAEIEYAVEPPPTVQP